MNTTVNNATLSRLQNILKANLAAAKPTPGKPPETTPLAEFNEQAGMKPHHTKSHTHASSANRNRLLTNLRRLQATTKTPQNAEKRDDESDDELFKSEMSLLLGALHGGGEGALKEWMSKRHDPLERHELLEYAIENSSGEDKVALSKAISELKSEHGEVLASAMKDANAIRSAVHQMITLSQADGADASLGGGSIFSFSSESQAGKNKTSESPSSALDLANRLMDKFGEEYFAEGLKKARSELSSQMRLKQGADLGPKMWLSMSNAVSFNAIQSTFAIGMELRRNLSEANIVPQAKEGETTRTLLNLAMNGTQGAEELATHLVGKDGLSPKQLANTFRLIAQAVDALPLTLWPAEHMGRRMNLIDELRTLGGTFSSQMQQTKESKDAKLERMLRQELAILKSTGKVGEQ